MKCVAVICSNYSDAVNWLRNELEIQNIPIISFSNRILNTTDTKYIFCYENKHLTGLELDGYLISPDFSTLVDVAKTRLKHVTQ